MNKYHARALLGMLFWLLIMVWAFVFPGGSHDETSSLLNSLIRAFSDPSGVNAYLFAHFSLMGLWPWVILAFYAGETPFRGNLWSKILVFLFSNVAGAFVILPYEALRSSEPKRLPPRWFFRLGHSRWFALILFSFAGAIFLYSVVKGGFKDYLELVVQSSFVRIMLVDFFLFHALALRLLFRDSRDREAQYHPAQKLFFAVPLFGPLIYLLFRKQLEAAHPAMIRY